MPTRGRQDWAAQAVLSFLEQDHPSKELIILDDTEELSFPLGVVNPQVRYELHSQRLTIAEKRNRCCELTSGEIIAHFDSDDWSAPERISSQVRLLEESGKAVTGYCTMPFWDEVSKTPHFYRNNPHTWAVGTSLCFLRSWWETHRFYEHKYSREDNGFSDGARNAKQIVTVPCGHMMVARLHAGNTVDKHPYNWPVKGSMQEIAPAFLDQCKPVS